MTREEAYEKILELRLYGGLVGINCTEALDMAIDALEQEPCEDAISRQAVLNILFYKSDNNSEVRLSKELRDRIKSLSPVKLQPKTGYISIDDVISVFDDFMCGDVDENDTETFLEMLKDKAEK